MLLSYFEHRFSHSRLFFPDVNLDNLCSVELERPDLTPLPIIELHAERESNIKIGKTRHQPESTLFESSAVTAVLFVEQGGASRFPVHVYSNHRRFNPGFLTDVRYDSNNARIAPLLESCAFDRPGESFDGLTRIMVHPYEICSTSEWSVGHPCAIRTAAAVLARNGGGGVDSMSFMYQRGIIGQSLTGKGFKRLLRVFGYSWTNNKGEEYDDNEIVPPSHFASFLVLFRSVSLRDKAAFVDFLKKFNLENFYQFDDNIIPEGTLKGTAYYKACLLANVANLARLLRCLHPVRITAPEGQHRLFCMNFVWNLHLDPSTTVPLKQKCGDAIANIVFNNWNNNQVFKQLRMKVIGIPSKPPLPFHTELQGLRRIGEDQTEGGRLNIQVDFRNLNEDVLEKLLDSLVDAQSQNPWSFNNFWSNAKELSQSVVADIIRHAWQALSRTVKRKAAYAAMLQGASTVNWKENVQTIEENFMKLSLQLVTDKGQNKINNSSYQTGIYLWLLRATCTDIETMTCLKRLFHKPQTEFPQCNALTQRELGVHMDFTWYRDVLIPFCFKAHKQYMARFEQDQRVIEQLRKAVFDPDWLKWFHGIPKKHSDERDHTLINLDRKKAYEEFVRNGGWIDPEQYKHLTIPKCPKRAKDRGKVKVTPSKFKVALAFTSVVVSDVVECLIKYGFDPDIPAAFQETSTNPNLKAWFKNFR